MSGGCDRLLTCRPLPWLALLFLSVSALPVHAGVTLADPTPTIHRQNVDLLGHVGGACRAVTLNGEDVLIGQGPRLVSVDLSNPREPKALGSILFPSLVERIAVGRDLIGVLAGDVWFVDVRDPAAPRIVSRLALSGEDIFLNGTEAYVIGNRPDIQVVSLRNPGQPTVVATYDLPQESTQEVAANAILIAGSHAYVRYTLRRPSSSQLTEHGFVVLDVSKPKTPRLLSDFRLQPAIRGFALHGDIVYLILEGRVLLVNVADARVPGEVGIVSGPRSPTDIFVSSERIYIIGDEAEIWVFEHEGGEDRPTKILQASVQGRPRELVAREDLVLVAGGWAGLRVLRFEALPQLRRIGTLEAPGDIADIAVAGDLAYVADGRAGVRVFSLLDPDHPEEIERFFTHQPAVGISVNGAHVYAAVEGSGLQIFTRDAMEPLKPVAFQFTGGGAKDVDGLGQYAFVADGRNGLVLIRTIDPASPVVFGRFDPTVNAISVVAWPDRAFVTDLSSNLWMVDPHSPANPVAAARLRTEGVVYDMAFDGRHLALAETDRGLRVVEVGEDNGLRTLGALRRSGWFQGVALGGAMAYVADASFGLRVIGLPKPHRPSEAGFIATAGSPRRVAFAHGRAYLAAGEAGLYVLRYDASPDLTARGFGFGPQNVFPGDEIRISGEILNVGTTPTAAAAWVDLVVSKEYDFSGPRSRLAPRLRVEAGLDPRGSIDLSQQPFVVLKTVPDGVYRLGILIDADNEVAELDEHNNLWWLPQKPLTLGPPPTTARRWEMYN